MNSFSSEVISIQHFDGQKPGTSGLRKPTATFMQAGYTEAFAQAIVTGALGEQATGSALALGGDGRYFIKQAADIIVRVCAANGVAKLVVGQAGIMSTPALSALVRKRKLDGGILLTASHNPGGVDKDFGIKFNTRNGGPAPEVVTDAIFAASQALTQYRSVSSPQLVVDLDRLGEQAFQVDGRCFVVKVVDPVEDYLALMRELFDFVALRRLLASGFRVLVDAMHGVTGPYVHRVLCQELGLAVEDALRCTPLPDFGGGHPDPNLTYADALVDAMKRDQHDLGVAFDGDGDRNMILGRAGFFVTPCDALAVLADQLECVPDFQRRGVAGFARSMPTSGALDRVAAARGLPLFEVPTGWKFFGNLMDAGQLSLCGEESFGTGSDHVREKDGMWALLAWLSVLAAERDRAPAEPVSVQGVLQRHWAKYGRNFFTRYDYENVAAAGAERMVAQLRQQLDTLVGREFQAAAAGSKTYRVATADDFSYTDPIDGSVTRQQGIRVVFEDGSRLVFRLSGTGSAGATVRLYVDSYEADPQLVGGDAQLMLAPLVEIALQLSDLKALIGRELPTVIT